MQDKKLLTRLNHLEDKVIELESMITNKIEDKVIEMVDNEQLKLGSDTDGSVRIIAEYDCNTTEEDSDELDNPYEEGHDFDN